MNCLLHSIFFDNPELPEQVCRFCESIPEYVQAREEYCALAQELEETMGRQWYFTFEDRLNQYCGWESRAYYLFGLNLRREILEGFQRDGLGRSRCAAPTKEPGNSWWAPSSAPFGGACPYPLWPSAISP